MDEEGRSGNSKAGKVSTGVFLDAESEDMAGEDVPVEVDAVPAVHAGEEQGTRTEGEEEEEAVQDVQDYGDQHWTAAVKIQSRVRGSQVRARGRGGQGGDGGGGGEGAAAEEEAGQDVQDYGDQHRTAAVKIQSRVRGSQVRARGRGGRGDDGGGEGEGVAPEEAGQDEQDAARREVQGAEEVARKGTGWTFPLTHEGGGKSSGDAGESVASSPHGHGEPENSREDETGPRPATAQTADVAEAHKTSGPSIFERRMAKKSQRIAHELEQETNKRESQVPAAENDDSANAITLSTGTPVSHLQMEDIGSGFADRARVAEVRKAPAAGVGGKPHTVFRTHDRKGPEQIVLFCAESLLDEDGREGEADARFWCSSDILADSQAVRCNRVERMLDGDIREWQKFDCSSRRLEQIFQVLQRAMHKVRVQSSHRCSNGGFLADENTSEVIEDDPSSVRLWEILAQHDLELGPNAVHRLLQHYLLSSATQMTSSHFESIYQRLKLAQLFPQGFDFRAGVMSGKVGGAQQRGKLLVMDYTDLQVLGDPDADGHILHVRDWFFVDHSNVIDNNDNEHSGNSSRWVHMQGLSPINLLRLGVKYQLRPHTIEDCLRMKKQPSKVEKLDSNWFCTIRLMQLVNTVPQKSSNTASLSPAASFASMVMKMASVAWSRKRFLFRASPVPADAGVQDEWEGQRESHGLQRQEGQEEFTKGDDHDDNGEEDEPPMVQIHCSFVSVWVVRSEGSKDGRNNTVITIFDSGNQEADNLQLQVSVSDLSPSKTMEKSRRSRDLMTSWGSFKGVQHVKDRTILHASTRGRRDIKGSKRNICNINRTCSCTCANGGCPPAEVDDIFDEIRQELRLSNTRLRENAPESLFYAVVAKTVEELLPICSAWLDRLHYFQALIDKNDFWRLRSYLPEVSNVHLDAKETYKTIRPTQGILAVLLADKTSNISDKGQSETDAYLRDVKDKFEQVIEGIHETREMCDHIERCFKGYQDEKANRTLTLLTVITSIFLPIQLASGIYGMNFQEVDEHGDLTGRPGMPELRMQHGYLFFWLITISLAISSAMFLRYLLI